MSEKVYFSVCSYDFEGDLVDDSFFVHLEDRNVILRFKDVPEIEDFRNSLTKLIEEIKAEY